MNKCLVVLFGFSLKNSEHTANVLSVLQMLPPPQGGSCRSEAHFTDPEMKAASSLITFLRPKQVLKLQISPSHLFPIFLQMFLLDSQYLISQAKPYLPSNSLLPGCGYENPIHADPRFPGTHKTQSLIILYLIL